jgi:hypothetical protein
MAYYHARCTITERDCIILWFIIQADNKWQLIFEKLSSFTCYVVALKQQKSTEKF